MHYRYSKAFGSIGNLRVGKAYTGLLDLKTGDEFEIKLGRKQIRLVPADLRRDGAGGPSVATAPKPIEAGGTRLLVEEAELEGMAVVAVLMGPEDRVIAQRRTGLEERQEQ